MTKNDLEFANNVNAALEAERGSSGWRLICFVIGILACGVIWAHWATLDEVTTGEGRVVTSSRLQVVQAWDGGIVHEILVKDGDEVAKGQLLIKLDASDAVSRLGEIQERLFSLEAQATRLRAEATHQKTVSFDPELGRLAPRAVQAENDAFFSRIAKIEQESQVLTRQLMQKKQEKAELEVQLSKTNSSLKLMERELEITRKLAKGGIVPEIELVRLERQVLDAKGERNLMEASIPRFVFAIEEAEERRKSILDQSEAEAREGLARVAAEMSVLFQSESAAKQRLARTELRAPVRGTVNRLSVFSLGAVIQPGIDVVEIVPIEDTLLVEAQISPRDIGFIRAGQSAKVKLTAFDYLQYGYLDGEVTLVGSDALATKDKESFFRVLVKTDSRALLAKTKSDSRILPGMIADVDILTGQKTVLQYLISPILRMKDSAMRER